VEGDAGDVVDVAGGDRCGEVHGEVEHVFVGRGEGGHAGVDCEVARIHEDVVDARLDCLGCFVEVEVLTLEALLDLVHLRLESGEWVLEVDVADENGRAGDAEGDDVCGAAGLVGIDHGVDSLGAEKGDERGSDLVGEGSGEGKLAVVGGHFGFEEGFEFSGLPPDEVGEMNRLKLVAGGWYELDDEGGRTDCVADVAEEAGVAETLEGGFNLLLGEGSVGRECRDAESFGGVDRCGRVEADGLGGVGLRC